MKWVFKRGVTWHTLSFEKKKLRVVAHFREQKPYAPKCEQGKTKIDQFRNFFTKSPMSKLWILFQLTFPHCIFICQRRVTLKNNMLFSPFPEDFSICYLILKCEIVLKKYQTSWTFFPQFRNTKRQHLNSCAI
jgi:hypothetical protein